MNLCSSVIQPWTQPREQKFPPSPCKEEKDTWPGSASMQQHSGVSAAALGSGNCPGTPFSYSGMQHSPRHCSASCLGGDTWCVCAHLGQQELGSSRGLSDSPAEGTRVLSAENQHEHHYWPVCHYVEHTKGFSLLSLTPVWTLSI